VQAAILGQIEPGKGRFLGDFSIMDLFYEESFEYY